MGSAAGILQTVNSLAMSLGIAGIGAIFFSLTSGSSHQAAHAASLQALHAASLQAAHAASYLAAAEWTALATLGLLVISFGLAFALPRRARDTSF
jgi:hypothetical protein